MSTHKQVHTFPLEVSVCLKELIAPSCPTVPGQAARMRSDPLHGRSLPGRRDLGGWIVLPQAQHRRAQMSARCSVRFVPAAVATVASIPATSACATASTTPGAAQRAAQSERAERAVRQQNLTRRSPHIPRKTSPRTCHLQQVTISLPTLPWDARVRSFRRLPWSVGGWENLGDAGLLIHMFDGCESKCLPQLLWLHVLLPHLLLELSLRIY